MFIFTLELTQGPVLSTFQRAVLLTLPLTGDACSKVENAQNKSETSSSGTRFATNWGSSLISVFPFHVERKINPCNYESG
jgi:hypothetical protein